MLFMGAMFLLNCPSQNHSLKPTVENKDVRINQNTFLRKINKMKLDKQGTGTR